MSCVKFYLFIYLITRSRLDNNNTCDSGHLFRIDVGVYSKEYSRFNVK